MKTITKHYLLIALLCSFSIVNAQTTLNTTVSSTGYTGTNNSGTNGFITFVIYNNSGAPIFLTDVGNWTDNSYNNTTSTLWYSSTNLSGTVGTLGAPDWTKVADNTVSGITATSLSVNNVITGMTFLIPDNTTYRFALHTTGTNRYSGFTGNPASPNNFSANGVTLYVGDHQISGQNVGYGMTFNPRFFTGSITFEPACSTAIQQQPAPASGCAGDNAMFSTVATDVKSYQWQVNDGNGFMDISNNMIYSGATTKDLMITGMTANMDGYEYRCVATKAPCEEFTDPAVLTVNDTITIDSFPESDTTCANSVKDLAIAVTGSVVGYEWQVQEPSTGFTTISPSANYTIIGDTLRITNVPSNYDGNIYRCIIKGVCEDDTSHALKLVVNTNPAVTTSPVDVVANFGDDVSFEVQTSGQGVAYRWQSGFKDTFAFINNGSIYQGVTTPKLRVNNVSRGQHELQFRCIVFSDGGCIAPGDTSGIALLLVPPTASVNSLSGVNEVSIYPNPVKGNELFVKIDGKAGSGQYKYEITNQFGQVVKNGKLGTITTSAIDVGALSSGIFMLSIVNEDGSVLAVRKFSKY